MTEPEPPSSTPALDPDVIHFGETKPQAIVCAWCGSPLPSADLESCPHCGAQLKQMDETLDVPGVTTLGPEAIRLLEIAEEKRLRKLKQPRPANAAAAVAAGP
ncbi:MAG: hypothetical protein ACHQ15_08020, partial [Candidatus Limnocylindrales bacterium]